MISVAVGGGRFGGGGGGGGRFGGGGRGHGNELVGKSVRITKGPFKGYKGRVTEVKGATVRVELDSQMKNVTGNNTLSHFLWFSAHGKLYWFLI